MTDKRQALIDAIQAIQQAREVYGKKPGQLPPGQFDIEVDPELDEPQHNTTDDLLDQDVEVEDPDNVLKDQKQQKQQRQQQSNQQKQNNSKEDEDEFDSESDEEDGDFGDESNDDDQEESDKQGNKKKSSNQEDESNKNENDESEDEDGEGKSNKSDEEELDPNYVKAWNEIMDRFDDDSISENDLKRLISDIKNGNIDSL